MVARKVGAGFPSPLQGCASSDLLPLTRSYFLHLLIVPWAEDRARWAFEKHPRAKPPQLVVCMSDLEVRVSFVSSSDLGLFHVFLGFLLKSC